MQNLGIPQFHTELKQEAKKLGINKKYLLWIMDSMINDENSSDEDIVENMKDNKLEMKGGFNQKILLELIKKYRPNYMKKIVFDPKFFS